VTAGRTANLEPLIEHLESVDDRDEEDDELIAWLRTFLRKSLVTA